MRTENTTLENKDVMSAYAMSKAYFEALPQTCPFDNNGTVETAQAVICRMVSGRKATGEQYQYLKSYAQPLRQESTSFLTYSKNATYTGVCVYRNGRKVVDEDGTRHSMRNEENIFGYRMIAIDFDVTGHNHSVRHELILKVAKRLKKQLPKELSDYLTCVASGGGMHIEFIFDYILPYWYKDAYNAAVRRISEIVYEELCKLEDLVSFNKADKVMANMVIRRVASFNNKYEDNPEFVVTPVLYSANADGSVRTVNPMDFVEYWSNGMIRAKEARKQFHMAEKKNHYKAKTSVKPMWVWTDDNLRNLQAISGGDITAEQVESFIAHVPEYCRCKMTICRAYSCLRVWDEKKPKQSTEHFKKYNGNGLGYSVLSNLVEQANNVHSRHEGCYSAALYALQYKMDAREWAYRMNNAYNEPLKDREVEDAIDSAMKKIRQFPKPFPKEAIEEYNDITMPTFTSSGYIEKEYDPEKNKEYNARRALWGKLDTASKKLPVIEKVKYLISMGYTPLQVCAQTGVQLSDETIARYVKMNIVQALEAKGYTLEQVHAYETMIRTLKTDTEAFDYQDTNLEQNCINEASENLLENAKDAHEVSVEISSIPELKKAMKEKRGKNNSWLPSEADLKRYRRELAVNGTTDAPDEETAVETISEGNPWGLYKYANENDIPLDELVAETPEDVKLRRDPEIRHLPNGKTIVIPWRYLNCELDNSNDDETVNIETLDPSDVYPADVDTADSLDVAIDYNGEHFGVVIPDVPMEVEKPTDPTAEVIPEEDDVGFIRLPKSKIGAHGELYLDIDDPLPF